MRSVRVMTAALAPAMPASSSARSGGASDPIRTGAPSDMKVTHRAISEKS